MTTRNLFVVNKFTYDNSEKRCFKDDKQRRRNVVYSLVNIFKLSFINSRKEVLVSQFPLVVGTVLSLNTLSLKVG